MVIKLDKDKIEHIFSHSINEDIEIDLLNQTIKINSDIHKFDIDSTLKSYLLEGIDEISTTLKFENSIKKYEINNDPLMFN